MPNRHFLAPLALAGAILGLTVGAFAQSTPAPAPSGAAPNGSRAAGHHHRGGMARALATLDLTSAQKSQIAQLEASYKASRSSATPQTRQQFHKAIENVLTPDQLTRFRTAMRHHHHRGAANAPGAALPGSPSP